MKLAVSVSIDGGQARAAAVAFEAWDALDATKSYITHVAHVEKAERGTLDLRELPCVMQLLREHRLEPELILIDGFVHLDADETPGLGQHLFHADCFKESYYQLGNVRLGQQRVFSHYHIGNFSGILHFHCA